MLNTGLYFHLRSEPMSGIGKYKPLPALSELKPPCEPMDYGVLIYRAEAEDSIDFGNGKRLYLGDQTKEDEEYLCLEGVIVAVSPIAFVHPDWPETARTPQVGDHVYTSRHPPGIIITGEDGRKYLLTQDKEIKGVKARVEDLERAKKEAA